MQLFPFSYYKQNMSGKFVKMESKQQNQLKKKKKNHKDHEAFRQMDSDWDEKHISIISSLNAS